MKMKYEKPRLEVIPFELNEAIASGCGLKVYSNSADITNCATDAWEELREMTGATLTADGNCSENPLEEYCQYTSNGTGIFLFSSN